MRGNRFLFLNAAMILLAFLFLGGYYYEEMVKRLNEVDKGRAGSVGYFLRRLWKKHESCFTMHEADVYSE